MRRTLYLGLALSLAALPALADNTITAGIDIWQTKNDGNTYADLTLPAGFFCTTSAALAAHVALAGNPIATSPSGVLGATDTVIERLGDATFNVNNQATVNAIVRAASFKSTSPVSVTGCSGSSLWDVKSSAAPTQSAFPITITRPSSTATGGTFSGSVTISPRLTFTQQGTGVQRTLDQAAVTFTTSGAEWTFQPGSGGVTYTAGSVQIDTDGNGVVDTTVPHTSNFAAGWSPYTKTGCSTAPCPAPITHTAPSHLHYVSPPPPYCTTASTGAATTTKAARTTNKLATQQLAIACVAQTTAQ